MIPSTRQATGQSVWLMMMRRIGATNIIGTFSPSCASTNRLAPAIRFLRAINSRTSNRHAIFYVYPEPRATNLRQLIAPQDTRLRRSGRFAR